MRLFAFLFLCVLFTPAITTAQETTHMTKIPVGHFVALEGDVFITNADEDIKVEVDDQLYNDDVLVTSDKARALIQFKDETELVLGANTELTIDEYVFDPNNTASNAGNFKIDGPFAWVSGLLPKNNENVTINSALGSIGIRGTTVWGGTLDEKYGVFVFDGKVQFTNDQGLVSIENGEGVFVDEINSDLIVKTWGQPKIQAAINTVAFAEGVIPTEKYGSAFTVKPKTDPTLLDDDEVELDPTETIPEVLEEPAMEEKE